MLDMGFIEDVELIISNASTERQTMLFSATMPREILGIARKHMKADVAKITVGEEEDLTVSTISHTYFIGNGSMKFAALLSYIEKFKPKKCIIFTSTQRESEYVHNFLRSSWSYPKMVNALPSLPILRIFQLYARIRADHLACESLLCPLCQVCPAP